MIYPEPGKGGRGHKGEIKEAARRGGFSEDRLTQARAILRHSSALAAGLEGRLRITVMIIDGQDAPGSRPGWSRAKARFRAMLEGAY
jgi:hypothetical protein